MAEVGYTKSVLVKTTTQAVGGYTALPGSAASIDLGSEMLDDTDFTSTGWRSRVRGLTDYSISVTNFFDTTSTILDTIRTSLLNNTRLDVRYLVNGSNGIQGRVRVESYSMTGDVGGLETLEVSMASEGTALSTL